MLLNYKNKSQSCTESKRRKKNQHEETEGGPFCFSVTALCLWSWWVSGRGVRGREGSWRRSSRGASYFWPDAGASEKEEEEEEGGEWALWGPVEGVSGGEGLPPTMPDWAICRLRWLIVRSRFSLASRSLRSSSCSSCRSASACSSL